MICFDTNIDQIVVDFFRSNIKALSNFQDTNVLIKRVCGINSFFQTENETKELLEKINDNLSIVSEPDIPKLNKSPTIGALADAMTEVKVIDV